MPGVGIEPTWDFSRGILSPLRLPFRHPGPFSDREIGGVERLQARPVELVGSTGHPNSWLPTRSHILRQSWRPTCFHLGDVRDA